MKLLYVFLLVFSALSANAQDSGLKCTMSYSSTDVLSSAKDSVSRWLVSGNQMAGSAVGVDKTGMWTQKPANYISVTKNGTFWIVMIFDDAKKSIGSFSFKEKSGMKATIKTIAFMANASEDPAKYDKLEVSCQFTEFAG